METCTYEDGDHSKHFVIKKDICVEFEESSRKNPKNFAVIFNGKLVNVKASASDDARSYKRQWTLDNEICVASDRDELLTFRVTYTAGKKKGLGGVFKTRKDVIVEIKLGRDVIARELKKQNNSKFSVSEESCTVSLEVAKGDIDDNIVDDSIEDLKPLLPERVQESVASGDAFVQDIGPLSSIIENIPVTDEAWQFIENAIETLGQAHPLAKAVLTALSIPYNLLKNEREFKEDMKDLAETMRFTAKCVADVQDHAKIVSAREQLTSITKTLRDAAQYVNTYVRRGKIGQFIGAQFPTTLQEYADTLIEQKNRLQVALIIQIVRDVDVSASITWDSFLRKHLDPIKGSGQSRGCLEGTRTKILEEIGSWLQDHESNQNILWLEGPPGAGKSTIATTIAKELAKRSPFCATFFCKRDVPDLRDPRNIWRTLAYNLADKHDGVKAALMTIVHAKECNLQHDSVLELFEKLIICPLDADRRETSFRSHRHAYPVVIIDALDECYATDDEDWDSLLSSLTRWSELCNAGVVKLIVTSRNRDDIYWKLNGLSRRVRLTTGDDVSADSKADVGVFLRRRFAEMRSNHLSSSFLSHPDWPGEPAINKMIDYAAGLFIWADMVVKYIARRAGGNDPHERLQEVLKDVETPTSPGIDGATQVDRLYARIVFEAFQYAREVELTRAKSALATIVLLKVPLGSNDLVELLSSDIWDARLATDSTLEMLSPIISTDDVNGKLRVCHKTVSDFLLSRSRSESAMEYVVNEWEQQMSKKQIFKLELFIINSKEEEWNIALACVRLLRRKLAKHANNVEGLLMRSGELLHYAFHHWLKHLEVASAGRAANLRSLAKAMEVAYGCLERHIGNPKLVSEDAAALIACIQEAADLAVQCIEYGELQRDLKNSLKC